MALCLSFHNFSNKTPSCDEGKPAILIQPVNMAPLFVTDEREASTGQQVMCIPLPKLAATLMIKLLETPALCHCVHVLIPVIPLAVLSSVMVPHSAMNNMNNIVHCSDSQPLLIPQIPSWICVWPQTPV